MNGEPPQILATEYARYRADVVGVLCSELERLEGRQSRPLVLYDPMAGTAPLIPFAEQHGYTAYFNDLNPLHLYVNSAKTLQSYVAYKEVGPEKLLTMCRMALSLELCMRGSAEGWIEEPVLDGLILAWKKSRRQREPIATLTRAIMLIAIRLLASLERTGNPTWRRPGGLRQKISGEEVLWSAIQRLDVFYQRVYANHATLTGGQVILTDQDASTWIPPCKVDVVMTSPPFCNRTDWYRLYAPEHFFLRALGISSRTRPDFLGTTVVKGYNGHDFESDFEFVIERSRYLARFLKGVYEHQGTKERRSRYYPRYYTRYFAGLFRVFDRVAQSLRKNSAGIFFVVQDNGHRGLPIQIGRALADSLSTQGFSVHRFKPPWQRHHLGLRNISKKYTMVYRKQPESLWHAVQ